MTTKRDVWNCRKKAVKNGWGNTYIYFSSLLKYNKNNKGNFEGCPDEVAQKAAIEVG